MPPPLLAGHGVRRGDVIATVLPNQVELVVAMYATWLLGAALTPVNPALTEDEVAYQLADAGVRLAVINPTTASLVGATPVIDADALLHSPPPNPPLPSKPRATIWRC